MSDTTSTKRRHVSIRKAQKEDLEEVWRMWLEIMDQKVFYPYDDTYQRKDIESEWVNLDNVMFVATVLVPENDGQLQIVGAYILKANQPGYGKHIVNAAYMVSSHCRGKGIGSALCQHSIGTAQRHGYRGMQFNLVVSTNEAAIRVWKANGFQIIGTVPEGFYHAGKEEYVDAYIFFRSLVP